MPKNRPCAISALLSAHVPWPRLPLVLRTGLWSLCRVAGRAVVASQAAHWVHLEGFEDMPVPAPMPDSLIRNSGLDRRPGHLQF